MRSRLVTQYICEHCGKRGLSASHMARHEASCTRNPQRECRMPMCGEVNCQEPVTERLRKLRSTVGLKDWRDFVTVESYTMVDGSPWESWDSDTAKKAYAPFVEAAAEMVEGCPACTLAILRQTGVPMCMFDFDYKAAREEWWAVVNEDHPYC